MCFPFVKQNRVRVLIAIIFAGGLSVAAQTFTHLANLDGTDGMAPSALVQGKDGNFYGTTARGGASNQGTVVQLTPAGTLTAIYNFCALASCADGLQPQAPLVLGPDASLYGTTAGGGAHGQGTFFRIGYDGTLSTLYSFCSLTNCTDGAAPTGAVVLESDGNFYGTTVGDPAFNSTGTIYRMTPSGTVTTLYHFCSKTDCADGTNSRSGLARDRGDTLYGTTPDGGVDGHGTIFRIESNGKFFKTLHNFCSGGGACTDGSFPLGPLLIGYDGNIYGTAGSGGANSEGAAFSMTPSGSYNLIYSFCPATGCLDGMGPQGGLFQATDGNFYGTTVEGGYNGRGVLFRFKAGVETRLHSFHVTDGAYPITPLMQGTDGNIYGSTSNGGIRNPTACGNTPFGCGTFFKESAGKPFVKPLQLDGAQGASVIVLGNGFTGTTSVTFNGLPANFAVASDTEITTSVPAAATSGKIAVVTPSGTLVSNIDFRVQ